MRIWNPPGYLTIDEMFSRVGSEIFGSKWTGFESAAGMVQPTEYWRDLELARKTEEAEAVQRRKAHSESARNASVSISGGPWGPPDRQASIGAGSASARTARAGSGFSRDRSTPLFPTPDWRSEQYVRNYQEDREAADRYQHAAKRIIDLSWHGKYLVRFANRNGEFLPLDKTTIQSEAFQHVISRPGTADRERLFFSQQEVQASSESASPQRQPDQVGARPRGKPGPKSQVRKASADKMFADLHDKRRTVEDLKGDVLEALSAEYGSSRNTAKLAREDAIARYSEFQKPEL